MKSVRYIMLFWGAFLAYHPVIGQSKSNSLDSTAALNYWYQPSFVIMHDMAIRNRVWIPEEIKNRSSLLGIQHSTARDKAALRRLRELMVSVNPNFIRKGRPIGARLAFGVDFHMITP